MPNSDFIPPGNYEGTEYDVFGFPNFKDNQVAQPVSKAIINMKGNYTTDFTEAKKALLEELKKTDPKAKVLEGPLRIEYNGQISEQMTWHHMQDCKTMQLVKTAEHKGKNHTGGVKIVLSHADLINFFN